MYAFIILSPLIFSSTKPFKSPIFLALFLNKGLVLFVMYFVDIADIGIVIKNISSNFLDIVNIIKNEPTNVTILVSIFIKSVESVEPIVSISYVILLSTSPIEFLSK